MSLFSDQSSGPVLARLEAILDDQLPRCVPGAEGDRGFREVVDALLIISTCRSRQKRSHVEGLALG